MTQRWSCIDGNEVAALVAHKLSGIIAIYRPDLDLVSLEVSPRITFSTSEGIRLPLRWIGIQHGQISAWLAATSGVHTAVDVLKVLLAGASAGARYPITAPSSEGTS